MRYHIDNMLSILAKSYSGFLLALLVLNSCASILNGPTTQLTVTSDRPVQLQVDGVNHEVLGKTKIKVKRQNEVLTLHASNDRVNREIKLKPINSFNYYANVLTYGLGFIWDNGPKRYTYPRKLYMDLHSPEPLIASYRPTSKNQTNLVITLPWINSFHLKPANEPTKDNTGFWGLSLGVDKIYKPHKFLNLTAGLVSDFFVPVPAAVDISGEYELMSSAYFSLTDNLILNRWSLGYGISYSWNTWDFRYYDQFGPPPPTRDPVTKGSQSVGLSVSSYYRCSQSFYVGVVYRPMLLVVNPELNWKYEYVVSFDLAWRIRLNK